MVFPNHLDCLIIEYIPKEQYNMQLVYDLHIYKCINESKPKI